MQIVLLWGKNWRNHGHPGHEFLKEQAHKRRRGRPRLSWRIELSKHVEKIDPERSYIVDAYSWRKIVQEYRQ